MKLDQIVRNYGGPKGFWDRLKSISVAEVAREADRPLNIAVIGAPDVRAEAHNALFSDPGSIALNGRALPVAPGLHGYDALTTEANFPEKPGVFDFVLDLGNGSREGLSEGTTVYSIRELGGWEATLDRIVEDRPDIELALARSFPIFRSRVAQRIINATALTNAQFTLITGIAAAFPLTAFLLPVNSLSDIVILTKNQIMMTLRLAAAYGLEVDYKSRMKEVAPILANAFGWRAIARELVGAVPVVGVLAKPAISYAGTVTVGKAAQVYYQTGENLSAAQLRRIYKEAYALSREKLRALTANVRSKRKPVEPEAELPQLTAAPMELNDIEYIEEPTDAEHGYSDRTEQPNMDAMGKGESMAMSTSTKHYVSAVVGVYPDYGQAQNALRELTSAGIPTDDISLVGREDDVRQAQRGDFAPPPEELRGEVRSGAVLGGEIGAATGFLSALMMFLIPGLGAFAALGALAGMLMGAGLGTIAGGVLGALGYEDEAIDYRALLEKGNLLVIVHCTTADEEKQAHTVLSKTPLRELHRVPYAS